MRLARGVVIAVSGLALTLGLASPAMAQGLPPDLPLQYHDKSQTVAKACHLHHGRWFAIAEDGAHDNAAMTIEAVANHLPIARLKDMQRQQLGGIEEQPRKREHRHR